MTTDTALEPAEVVRLLDEKAREMDNLGRQLGEIRQALEPVQGEYDEHLEAFVAGLWDRYLNGELKGRFPGEDVRVALAHRELDTELRGRYTLLKDRERRCLDAIGRAKESIGAYRSILSAQKEGLI